MSHGHEVINTILIYIYGQIPGLVLLLIIYNCKVSVRLARKLSRLNGDPFLNRGQNDKK